MALIKCEKCGEMISDKAKRCPHCVREYSKKENNLRLVLIILGIIIVALIMMTTIR